MIIDEQVEQIREIARQYSKLDYLTRLPDSLSISTPCKTVDQIRGMAIAYVMNEVLDRTIKEDARGEEVKQRLSIPRPLISPFVGIPAMEFDPMDLVGGSW